MAERGSEMGFAGAGVAEEQYVLVVLKVFSAHEFAQEYFVDAGLGVEVEGVEGLEHGKFRGFDAAFGGALLLGVFCSYGLRRQR